MPIIILFIQIIRTYILRISSGSLATYNNVLNAELPNYLYIHVYVHVYAHVYT